jgi:hypothetical protein
VRGFFDKFLGSFGLERYECRRCRKFVIFRRRRDEQQQSDVARAPRR